MPRADPEAVEPSTRAVTGTVEPGAFSWNVVGSPLAATWNPSWVVPASDPFT